LTGFIFAPKRVTSRIFSPISRLNPRIIPYQTKLTNGLALVTFANSITLTPGTITVYISLKGDFKVHAIDKASGEPLPGEMEAKIAKVFGEV
jgi:multicomponent Na+:H+ antiporter subunit E